MSEAHLSEQQLEMPRKTKEERVSERITCV